MATTLGVHVSWTGLPGDKAVQWSDVSSDVTAIDTQRGRSTELDQVQTGTASIEFDNWNGAYTPGRPYGPELLPLAVKNTSDATQWTHGPHAALSINSGKNPPAGYLGTSTVLEIDMTSAVAQEDQALSAAVPVTPGKAYRGSFLMQSTGTAAGIVSARLAFYNAAGVEITTGIDFDFAYRQYADVVKASLPDTYHRMGAYETLTNQSNALVGVDPMVCYNVGSAASWSKNQGSGPGSAAFTGTSFSVAEACGVHLVGQSMESSVELWFQTTTAAPILAEYNFSGLSWTNPVAANGTVDSTSGKLWPALYVGTDGYLYAQSSVLNVAQVKSAVLVNDGLWHHYVVAGSPSGVTYYLDGVAMGTDTNGARNPARPIIGCADITHNTTLPHATGTPALAALPATGFFTGNIADFAQYRHGLSAQDVANHYRHGSTSTKRIPINSGANLGWWFPVQAAAVAPAGAVKASLVMRTEQAVASSSLWLYSASVKEINPNYGKILPRRKVRVFSTTGQNLVPPGLNLGYFSPGGVPASGVDLNETGTWFASPSANYSVSASNGVTTYGPSAAYSSNSGANFMYLNGPTGNGWEVPWMLVPGNTYTFTAQARVNQFSASATSTQLWFAAAADSDPSFTSFVLATTNTVTVSAGDHSWKTLTSTFTIPATYSQPVFGFRLATSETSTAPYTWLTDVKNLQLVDVTNGQTVPAYTPGDGTMPVFQGFVDKWESLTEYDDTASVVATCSDPMRIMGDTMLPKAPQAFGFQPDWRVLGSWEMNGQLGMNPVDPNQQIVGGYLRNANTVYNNMTYAPGFSSATLPGDFLGTGNLGAMWQTSPAIYLMSFGKLAAGMSIEFWFIPRQNTTDPNPGNYPASNQYLTANGPLVMLYAATANTGSGGSTNTFSCGWTDLNATSAGITAGTASDMLQGGHVAIELSTTGGAAPKVVTKLFYNGINILTSSAETLTLPADPQFRLSGNANLTINSVSVPPATFELYAPASYAGTGLDWTTRLAAFKSGRVSANWSNSTVIDGPPAQTVVPWLMGACGLARPSAQLVTGSPASSALSLVDPASFTSSTGLDGINTITQQLGGLVCMSRYSAVMIQDSGYRTDSIVPYVFSALGGTAPDASLLFLSDIDRTWTEVDFTQGASNYAVNSYPAYLRYGSHRQSMLVRDADLNQSARPATFLSSYMIPATRCDSAQFTVINQALASSVMLVDVGSRVVFTDLPANAPTDQFFAWVESVAVSAKADGGTLVPTVTFSLSPDFAHLPIQ